MNKSKIITILVICFLLMCTFSIYLLGELSEVEREHYKLKNSIITIQQERNRCVYSKRVYHGKVER